MKHSFHILVIMTMSLFALTSCGNDEPVTPDNNEELVNAVSKEWTYYEQTPTALFVKLNSDETVLASSLNFKKGGIVEETVWIIPKSKQVAQKKTDIAMWSLNGNQITLKDIEGNTIKTIRYNLGDNYFVVNSDVVTKYAHDIQDIYSKLICHTWDNKDFTVSNRQQFYFNSFNNGLCSYTFFEHIFLQKYEFTWEIKGHLLYIYHDNGKKNDIYEINFLTKDYLCMTKNGYQYLSSIYNDF